MTETLIQKLTKTREGMRLYQQERAIQEVTDLICEVMDEENVSRAELAQRLAKTKGYVTQLLDGRANMTIRTISDVFTALERAVHFQDGPVSATVSRVPTLSIKEVITWEKHAPDWLSEPVWGQPTSSAGKLAG